MSRYISIIMCACIAFFGVFLRESSAAIVYIPAPVISMTGSSSDTRFDVDAALYGYSVSGAYLDTTSSTFSGAFYLSGAGWILFSTGTYRVDLDCGGQPLASLTADCSITGTGYSEMVGDVVLSGAIFHHDSGELTGTISTYIGDYSLSGVVLPLLPAQFAGGMESSADHAKSLSISGGAAQYGNGSWQIYFDESTTLDSLSYTLSTLSNVDLSLAGAYDVHIRDPQGSETLFDYTVTPDLPKSTLIAGSYRHGTFCTSYPTSGLCPDGATLTPTILEETLSAAIVVANGVDTYSFVLKLRDRYGNAVTDGQVRVDYRDAIREIQTPNISFAIYPYISYGSGYAIQATGLFGGPGTDTPTTGNTFANLGDITYSIASIAPTSTIDTLTLSGVIYTDALGVQMDIADPLWKSPLEFAPWYTTSLSAIAPIVVGSPVEFTATYAHTTLAPLPNQPTAIYSLLIGGGVYASFQDFRSSSIGCMKYTPGIPTGPECNWMSLPDTAIISTDALSFSGVYSNVYDPLPETVSYESYIRYMIGGVTVLYPSGAGSLGPSVAGAVKMKVLGQQNISARTGISPGDKASIWNSLRKNTTLLSRNRSNYSDVDYSVGTSPLSITDTMLDDKRTLVVVGSGITITENLMKRDRPIAIIALTDAEGHGGDIVIAPGVQNVYASLFAEKSVKSTGTDQLYIYGSVISYNTVSDTECPYYLSTCTNPEKYNLENLRSDFLTATVKTLATGLAGKYATIPLVIEYDGRVLTDPPPILEK